jgi:hypothetical protein
MGTASNILWALTLGLSKKTRIPYVVSTIMGMALALKCWIT